MDDEVNDQPQVEIYGSWERKELPQKRPILFNPETYERGLSHAEAVVGCFLVS